jgi:hypothetical protein
MLCMPIFWEIGTNGHLMFASDADSLLLKEVLV